MSDKSFCSYSADTGDILGFYPADTKKSVPSPNIAVSNKIKREVLKNPALWSVQNHKLSKQKVDLTEKVKFEAYQSIKLLQIQAQTDITRIQFEGVLYPFDTTQQQNALIAVTVDSSLKLWGEKDEKWELVSLSASKLKSLMQAWLKQKNEVTQKLADERESIMMTLETVTSGP